MRHVAKRCDRAAQSARAVSCASFLEEPAVTAEPLPLSARQVHIAAAGEDNDSTQSAKAKMAGAARRIIACPLVTVGERSPE
jgi:hypothetical protein